MVEVKVSNLVEVRILFALLRKSHSVVIYVSCSDNKANPGSGTKYGSICMCECITEVLSRN